MATKIAVSSLLILLEVNFILSQCIPTSGRQIILQPVQQTCSTSCADQLQQETYHPVVHYQTSEPIVVKPTIAAVAEPLRCQNKPNTPRPITSTIASPATIIIQEENEDQGLHPLLFYTLLSMMRRDCNDNCRYSYNDNCDRCRYPYNYDNNCDRCRYSYNDNCDRCRGSYNNDNCNYGRRNCCDYTGFDDWYGGCLDNYYDPFISSGSCYNSGCNCNNCGSNSCNSCSCGYNVDKCCDGNEINLVIRPNDCTIGG